MSHFGVRMSANVQQKLNSKPIKFLKEYLTTSIGKWLKSDRKMSKVRKFLSISDIFSDFFFEILVKEKLRKSWDVGTRSEARF